MSITPIIKGSEINDNPYMPISKYAVDTVNEKGDETEIEWIAGKEDLEKSLLPLM
jgi:magnesium chelatase subunit I